MGLTITGIATPVALAAIALLGYLISRHQRRSDRQAESHDGRR